MNNSFTFSKITFFLSVFFIISNSVKSQKLEKKILTSYESFSSNTKEVAFVHLNKSVYIKNETLGFTAYIFDKTSKTPLTITKNLYFTITDENGKIIKQKLLKVDNGVTFNVFDIDDDFTSGEYTIRAFTNWMLNFNERNYFEQTFIVLDGDIKKEKKKKENQFSVQVLPEGGHLVANTKNSLGIIAKNTNGIGIQNATGKLVDENNNTYAEFTLNQFGIAKVAFTPKANLNYSVIINLDDQQIKTPVSAIKLKGITLSVLNLRNKIGITLNTNKETIKNIQKSKYLIAIHNGAAIKMIPFSFKEDLSISKIVNFKDLYSGINIITVFDTQQKKPILERLFFNRNGIKKITSADIESKVNNDSINFKVTFNQKIDVNKLQNLSVSILPKNTKSYTAGSSILSQLYLEPYVKGFIQNARYYFLNNNAKTNYDLDNLLITQGWSSYNWNSIFEVREDYNYKFEQGINVVANIKSKIKEGFLVYPLKNNTTKIFNPAKEDKAFIHTNLYPLSDEFYRVSLLKKRERTSKPKLDLEFYPNKIPKINTNFYESKFQYTYAFEDAIDKNAFSKLESDVELLEGITIKSKKEEDRIKKIKNSSRGNVDFFTDDDSKGGGTLATYLSTRGWIASDLDGYLSIVNPTPSSPNNVIPLVILDDVQLDDFSFLAGFSLSTVDYIESNKSGIGYGIRGGGGIIKIKTDPIKRMGQIKSKNEVAAFEFPLTFNVTKKYYTPIYQDYNSKFFKNYGVIDWKPNLKVNENDSVSFPVLNTLVQAVNIYIEGFVNEKSLVSEIKTIDVF